MLGGKCDLLVPALIGLGLFAQSNELCLANNTSILLILFLLLKEDKHHHRDGFLDGGVHALGARDAHGRSAFGGHYPVNPCCPHNPCATPIGRFDDRIGCPCGCIHHHHERKRRRREEFQEEFAEEVAEEVQERLRPSLERITRCACRHHRHHRDKEVEHFL